MDNTEFSFRMSQALDWDGRKIVCFSSLEGEQQWIRFAYVSTGSTAEHVLRDGGGDAFMAQIPELAPVEEGSYLMLEDFTKGYVSAAHIEEYEGAGDEEEEEREESIVWGISLPDSGTILENIRKKVQLSERDEALASSLSDMYLQAIDGVLSRFSSLPADNTVSTCEACNGSGIQILPCQLCLGNLVSVKHLGLIADPEDLILDDIIEAHERVIEPEDINNGETCESCQDSRIIMRSCSPCAGAGVRGAYITLRFVANDNGSLEVPMWLPHLYERGFTEFGCEVVSEENYARVRCWVEFRGLVDYLRKEILELNELDEFYVFTDKTEMLYEYLQGFAIEFGLDVQETSDGVRYRLDLLDEDPHTGVPVEDRPGWLSIHEFDQDTVEELLVRGFYFASDGDFMIHDSHDVGVQLVAFMQKLVSYYWAEMHYESVTVEEQQKEAKENGVGLAYEGYVVSRDGFLIAEQDSVVLLREISEMLAPYGYAIGLGYRFTGGLTAVNVVSIMDESGYIYGDIAAGHYWECVLLDARRNISRMIQQF